MPEAVIVSTARTPIGRAGKGSLVDARPDDLAAFAVRAALDQVPGLPREEIVDVIVGCGFPAGEAGDEPRPARCAPRRAAGDRAGHDREPFLRLVSLQTIRMAFHAIKAGEGDAFVAAGVESISQVNGYPKSRGRAPPRALRRRRADRERLHPDGPHGRERRRAVGRLARRHGPLRAAVAGARRRGAGVRVLRARDHAVRGRRRRRRAAALLDAREARSRSSRRSSRAAR